MNKESGEFIKYSVIVLLEEENEDIVRYILDIYSLFFSQEDSFEIVILANGTEGFLQDKLEKLHECSDNLKIFSFNKKISQAVCLKAGLKECRGQIFVVCGSYQQITNDSLVKLLDALDDKADVISPWRQYRVDPPFNRLQSRLFNFLVRKITKSDLHDLSNTVKVFRREVLEETELYGGMYRFLPILAAQKGFNYREVKCDHYQEHGKTGFYSLSDYLARILDIITLYFNIRFTRKPLRFFSTFGLFFLITGVFIMGYVFFQKIFLGHPIGGRPVLLLALLFMVVGVQVASAGLLGEIVAFVYGRQKKEYSIDKKI